MTKPVARVVASYDGVPCAHLRPDDAPTRPGEPCGEIHERCRGHVRTKTADRYGDPCHRTPEPGLCVCKIHGGQLPEPANVAKVARARRAYGRLVGHTSQPVEDPVAEFATGLGLLRDWRDGLLELVAEIQNGDDPHLVAAGDEFFTVDAGEGSHPAITGNLLVLDPAGHYRLHPVVIEARAAIEAFAKASADAVKIGLEERQTVLAERQIDLTIDVLKVVFERLGLDPDSALGMFVAAARDRDAIDTTIGETIRGHVTRTLDAEVSA